MAGQTQKVDPGWGWNEQFGYAQGIRAGGMIYVAGQMPVNPQTAELVGEGDLAAQTRQTFENIRAVLAAAGASMEDIVELVTYHTEMSMDNLGVMGEIKAEFMGSHLPAWTALGVTALAFPGQMIEIKVVAVAP